MVLLALVAAAGLAAVLLAGAFPWRSSQTLTTDGTATPSGGATVATSTKLPPAADDDGAGEGGPTDPELRSQVWSTIVSFYANVRGCEDVLSYGIRVNQQPDAAGSWQETWDVLACGEPAALKIMFTIAPDGGIFYDITE